MLLYLSKSELACLEALCGGAASAGGLALKLSFKPSFVSRLLRSLEEKALVCVERSGAGKTISLSLASHAQAFKRLFESRPNAGIEPWLCGAALDVLAVAGFGEGASAARLERECACSKPTIYRTLKALKSAGVAASVRGNVVVSDALVLAFANAFADNVHFLLQKNLKGGVNASVRVRKHVVVRTDAVVAPPFFAATGVNALAERRGLKALRTSYSDYYFNLDGERRELSVEECFVHALVLTTLQQHQDRPVLALFLRENSVNAKNVNNVKNRKFDVRVFDAGKLAVLARDYAVGNEFNEIKSAVGLYEKMKDAESKSGKK